MYQPRFPYESGLFYACCLLYSTESSERAGT